MEKLKKLHVYERGREIRRAASKLRQIINFEIPDVNQDGESSVYELCRKMNYADYKREANGFLKELDNLIYSARSCLGFLNFFQYNLIKVDNFIGDYKSFNMQMRQNAG